MSDSAKAGEVKHRPAEIVGGRRVAPHKQRKNSGDGEPSGNGEVAAALGGPGSSSDEVVVTEPPPPMPEVDAHKVPKAVPSTFYPPRKNEHLQHARLDKSQIRVQQPMRVPHQSSSQKQQASSQQ